MAKLVAEWQVLQDAIGIRLVHNGHLAQPAHTFGVFGFCQVPAARV